MSSTLLCRHLGGAFGLDQLGPDLVPVVLTKLPTAQASATQLFDPDGLFRLHRSPASEALIQVLLIEAEFIGNLFSFSG